LKHAVPQNGVDIAKQSSRDACRKAQIVTVTGWRCDAAHWE